MIGPETSPNLGLRLALLDFTGVLLGNAFSPDQSPGVGQIALGADLVQDRCGVSDDSEAIRIFGR
jgi:hypothetical protein